MCGCCSDKIWLGSFYGMWRLDVWKEVSFIVGHGFLQELGEASYSVLVRSMLPERRQAV